MFGHANIVDRVEDCGYGNDFEFAVLRDGRPYYDSGVTSDVVRGDWTMMEKLKCMVTDLNPDHLAS
jgi:hypothetical protein